MPGPTAWATDPEGLPPPGFAAAQRLGGGGDLAEVIGGLELGGVWVELVGELLESLRGPLDLVVCDPFVRA